MNNATHTRTKKVKIQIRFMFDEMHLYIIFNVCCIRLCIINQIYRGQTETETKQSNERTKQLQQRKKKKRKKFARIESNGNVHWIFFCYHFSRLHFASCIV